MCEKIEANPTSQQNFTLPLKHWNINIKNEYVIVAEQAYFRNCQIRVLMRTLEDEGKNIVSLQEK